MNADDWKKTQPDAEEWEDSDHSGVTDDEWHRHDADERPQHAHGETTPGAIASVGIVSFVLLVLMFAGVWIYFNQVNRQEYDEKRDMWLGAEVQGMKDAWDREWREYAWADPAKQRIRVPLEKGVAMTAAEYVKKSK